MAVIVDNDTRLVVQGLTGSQGRFPGLRNRGYGTNVAACVPPATVGTAVAGHPVFNPVPPPVLPRHCLAGPVQPAPPPPPGPQPRSAAIAASRTRRAWP